MNRGTLTVVAQATLVSWTHNLSAHMVNEARISYGRLNVEFGGNTAKEAARYDMGERIREVEQGPDGSLWLLEDGSGGRLLQLTPVHTPST